MKKILFVILCILPVTLGSCQKKRLSQETLSDKFSKDWCDCMEKESEGKTPEEIISQVSLLCVQNVMLVYTQDEQLYGDIRKLVAEKDYDDTLSDYDKERLFGRELGLNLMANAVDNCVIYRESLIQFKRYYIEKARQDMKIEDKDDVYEFIDNMQKQLDEIDAASIDNTGTKDKISNYYTLLGLLYENTDREDLAVEQYDKAIQFDPENTNAMGLKKLLVEYNNK